MSVLSEYRLATLDDTGNVPFDQLGNAPTGGGGGALPSNTRVVSANATAAVGDSIEANATTAALTITAPGSPLNGNAFGVFKTDASAHAVAVAGTVNGDSGGASITVQGTGGVFWFVGGTIGWHYVQQGPGGGGFANPMTTAGDLISGGTAGSPGRLGIGSNGQVLGVVSGALAWTTGGSPLVPVATVTVAGALVAGKHNPVDATSGTLAMTLPTGQSAGTQLSVEKEDVTANLVNVTGNIRGVGAVTFPLKLQFESQTFVADSAGSWWPTAGHKTLGSLDARYAPIASPTFTGVPSGPTAAPGTNTTQFATTAFLTAALAGVPNSTAYVNMCAAPYNHTPGVDVTADLQTVINAAVTAHRSTTIFWSIPGTYNINGAQQTPGTAFGYTPSGQILFPANTGAPVTIRIQGIVPTSGPFTDNDMFTSGTVLNSNATSGAVFDAIAAKNTLLPQTQVRAIFEDMHISVPSDPQCHGIVGLALETLQFRGNCGIYASFPITVPTGSTYGVKFGPVQTNSPQQINGYFQVVGFNTGIGHNEHFSQLGFCNIANCVVALNPSVQGTGSGSRHWSHYEHVLIQGGGTGIKPTGVAFIDGFVDIGDNGGWGGQNTPNVVDDASNNLIGSLMVGVYQDTFPPKGIPVVGAQKLQIARIPLGRSRPTLPYDDFTRMAQTSNSTYLGATPTGHVWSYLTGVATNWTIASNSLKANALSSGSLKALLPYRAGRAGQSRNIRAVITPTGTFNQFVLIGNVVSGTNAGNMLYVQVNAGGAKIGKIVGVTASQLAHTTSTSLFSTTVQATLDVVYSNPIGGPAGLTVVVNGVAQPLTIDTQGTTDGASIVTSSGGVASATFQLSASESAALVDTDLVTTQDGIQVNETTSFFNYFAIQPV